MDWNKINVTFWSEFTQALEPLLDAYKGHVPPVYVFRGQADASWLLEPSLFRHFAQWAILLPLEALRSFSRTNSPPKPLFFLKRRACGSPCSLPVELSCGLTCK